MTAHPLSRRAVLAGLVIAGPSLLLACSDRGGTADPGTDEAGQPPQPAVATSVTPMSEDTLVIPYGDGPNRYGHLDLPVAASAPAAGWPVAILIHGGFWRTGHGINLMFDLARSLHDDGWATWNIQYSQVGDDGGGWPGTFEDVAAAIDRLGGMDDAPLDLDRVIAVGHSAGGHLALWAAGRAEPPAATPAVRSRVRLSGVVSLAGVTDLLRCDTDDLGDGACRALMGVAPRRDLGRYLEASPIERVPTGVPTVLVHGDRDLTVPLDQSRRFAFRALEQGDRPTLLVAEGADHFDPIMARHPAWQQVRPLLTDLAG